MPVPTPLLWHLHRNLKKNLPIFTYYTPFTHCRPNAKMHLKKSCPHQHIVLVSYSMHFTSSYFLKLMQLYLSYICFYMTNSDNTSVIMYHIQREKISEKFTPLMNIWFSFI